MEISSNQCWTSSGPAGLLLEVACNGLDQQSQLQGEVVIHSGCQGIQGYFSLFWCAFTSLGCLCWQKRDVTREKWGCCIHRRWQTRAVKCWREKRNRSTTPLSTSKGQKLTSLKTNQKQAGRNYCQIFSGQWTAKELPKNKSPGLEGETGGRQKIPGKPGRCYLHGFQLLATCSLLDTSWWTDIFQAADVILLTGLLYLKLNLAELVNNSAQRTRMQNTSSQHEEHRSWASPTERLFPSPCLCSGHISGGELRQGWKPACSQRWAGILMISVSFVNCYKTLETPGSIKMKRK